MTHFCPLVYRAGGRGRTAPPTEKTDGIDHRFFLAGVVGIEPTTRVLETLVIPFHHAPMWGFFVLFSDRLCAPCGTSRANTVTQEAGLVYPLFPHVARNANARAGDAGRVRSDRGSRRRSLLRLLMRSVLVAPLAELLHLKARLERLLVLVGEVVHPVAVGALELDKIVL